MVWNAELQIFAESKPKSVVEHPDKKITVNDRQLEEHLGPKIQKEDVSRSLKLIGERSCWDKRWRRDTPFIEVAVSTEQENRTDG